MLKRFSVLLLAALVALAPASARAATLRSASFENATITDGTTGCTSVSGSLTRTTSGPITGSASASVSGVAVCTITFTATSTEVWVSFLFKPTALPSSSSVRIVLLRSSTTSNGNITLSSAGKLQLRNGGSNVGSVSALTVAAGSAYQIVLHQRFSDGLLDASAGLLGGSLSSFASVSGLTLPSTSLDSLQLGVTAGSVTVDSLLDDVLITDTDPVATPTNTPVPPTNTPTNTPVPPTNTPTNTPVPPTNTPTNTPVPPTNTPTNTPVPSTNTPTNTPVPGSTSTPTPGACGTTVAVTFGSPVLCAGDYYGFTFTSASLYEVGVYIDGTWVDSDTQTGSWTPTRHGTAIKLYNWASGTIDITIAPNPTATPTNTATATTTASPTNTPMVLVTPTNTPVPTTGDQNNLVYLSYIQLMAYSFFGLVSTGLLGLMFLRGRA